MSFITIIGRGHSGTRAISHTLSASGVYMGAKLNGSGDLVPAEDLYEACRVMARHIQYLGRLQWDFSALHTMPIDPAFTKLVESYLASVLSSDAVHKGWKLPETTLIFPWIVRMFPDNDYIYWIRDPRDCILGSHLTDDLLDFGVPYDRIDDVRTRRAISWKYQVEIVKATPKPRRWTTVRFEDFVLDQAATLRRLEQYLGFELKAIPVKPEAVYRWKVKPAPHVYDFFRDDLVKHGYPLEETEMIRPVNQPIRKAFVMSVNEGAEAEYERRHRPIWQELQEVLKSHGVHNYSIFLHPQTRQLFAYVEIDSEERWAAIARTDVCQRWWKHMGDIMPSNPDHSPVAADLREVFHMD